MLFLPFLPPVPGIAFVVLGSASAPQRLVLATAIGRRSLPTRLDPFYQIGTDGSFWSTGNDEVEQCKPDGSVKRRWTTPEFYSVNPFAAAISPDSSRIAAGSGTFLYVRSANHRAHWETIATDRLLEHRFRTTSWTEDVGIAWHPYGDRLVFAAALGEGGGSDGEVPPTAVEYFFKERRLKRMRPGRPVAWISPTGLLVERRHVPTKLYDGLVIRNGKTRLVARGVNAVAWSHGKIVALTGPRGRTVAGVVRIAWRDSDRLIYGRPVGL